MTTLAVNYHGRMIGAVSHSGERVTVGHAELDHNKSLGAFASAHEARRAVIKDHIARQRAAAAAGQHLPRLRPKIAGDRANMVRRRAEVIRLCQRRLRLDLPIPEDGWITVMVDVLALGDTFDLPALDHLACQCGIVVGEHEPMLEIHRISQLIRSKPWGSRYRPLKAETAGACLDLKLDEVLACGIVSMAAVDETPAQRQQRLKERRRETDRQRGERRRRATGIAPRTKLEGKPWEAAGISRATYYRRKTAARNAEQSRPQSSGETGNPHAILRGSFGPSLSVGGRIVSPAKAPRVAERGPGGTHRTPPPRRPSGIGPAPRPASRPDNPHSGLPAFAEQRAQARPWRPSRPADPCDTPAAPWSHAPIRLDQAVEAVLNAPADRFLVALGRASASLRPLIDEGWLEPLEVETTLLEAAADAGALDEISAVERVVQEGLGFIG